MHKNTARLVKRALREKKIQYSLDQLQVADVVYKKKNKKHTTLTPTARTR
jgi:hypothetical protein